ncbi:unnamed protein product, partial [Menidia menidia]
FQSKVLQKLYPASAKPVKDHNPPKVVELQTTAVKRKTSGQGGGKTQRPAKPCPRMYTVLPPPPEYNINPVALPQLESVNCAKDPAEDSVHESHDELGGEKRAEEQKRRRRRKKKPAPPRCSGNDGAAEGESSTGQSQAPVDEGGEHVSKNKRRKLKKKRHKEKMISLGLFPRASALEFTYHKDGGENKEGDNKGGVAELSDFLKRTVEIYMSDNSLREAKVPHLSVTVDDLLVSIASGSKPDCVLEQLCCLKALAQRRDTDGLQKALDELGHNPSMAA